MILVRLKKEINDLCDKAKVQVLMQMDAPFPLILDVTHLETNTERFGDYILIFYL